MSRIAPGDHDLRIEEILDRWTSTTNGLTVEREQRAGIVGQRLEGFERRLGEAKEEGEVRYDKFREDMKGTQAGLVELRDKKVVVQEEIKASCQGADRQAKKLLKQCKQQFKEFKDHQLYDLTCQINQRCIRAEQSSNSYQTRLQNDQNSVRKLFYGIKYQCMSNNDESKAFEQKFITAVEGQLEEAEGMVRKEKEQVREKCRMMESLLQQTQIELTSLLKAQKKQRTSRIQKLLQYLESGIVAAPCI